MTPAPRILAVDDEEPFLRALARILHRGDRFDVVVTPDPDEAIALIEGEDPFDVALVDLRLPGTSGLDLVARIKRTRPEVEAVVLTAHASIEHAVEAMRAGAYDFLTKPIHDPAVVLCALDRAVERKRLVDRARALERQLDLADRFEGIVWRSPRMRRLLDEIESVAPTDATVLLLGESGTGKELLARAIHRRSRRRARSMLSVNCAALTETLLESELFGHARGAFTGAATARRGLFEEATGGTLLLDEVGDVSPALQVRLLRVLQEGEVRPVGANAARKVDVRVIAATNRDLRAAVRAGSFREDLYFRLHVVAIDVPPLRDRPEDIPVLTQHFLRLHSERSGRAVQRVAPEALDRLTAHRWPGNVRELENAVERAVVLARGDTLRAEDLPAHVGGAGGVPSDGAGPLGDLHGRPFAEARGAFERGYLEAALARAQGSVAEAARVAGMDRSNFRRLLKKHGLGV